SQRDEVLLEGFEVEDQRRGVDFLEALADSGRRALAHAAAVRAARSRSVNHTSATATAATSGSAIRFTRSHPACVTVIPEVNEEIAIMMKIAWSFAPCALARSSGR